MKKFLFLTVWMTLGLCSCSNDQEEAFVDEITEADAFVASEQYQNYQEVMQNDSKLMRKLFNNLTDKERDYLRGLLSAGYTDEAKADSVCNIISGILGIDYKQRILRLMDIYVKTFQGSSYAPKSLLKSIQNYNASIQRVAYTRSGNNEASRLDCENACGVSYLSYYYSCLGDYANYSYAEHPWYEDQNAWLTFWNCDEQAKMATSDCFESCKLL